jgi:hypothetical protein
MFHVHRSTLRGRPPWAPPPLALASTDIGEEKPWICDQAEWSEARRNSPVSDHQRAGWLQHEWEHLQPLVPSSCGTGNASQRRCQIISTGRSIAIAIPTVRQSDTESSARFAADSLDGVGLPRPPRRRGLSIISQPVWSPAKPRESGSRRRAI